MEIRKLFFEDYIKFRNEITKLIADTYSNNFEIDFYELNRVSIEKTEKLGEFIKDGSAILIGCINDNCLIAFAWLYLHGFFDEKRVHVNQIAVHPSFRGKGIGKRLMLEVEKEAIRIDADTIDLYVMEKNKAAKNLYDSLNFQTEKLYMTKKLKVN